jgi:hypothetical protein
MTIKNTELSSFGTQNDKQDPSQAPMVNPDLDERKISTRTGNAQIIIKDNILLLSNRANGIMINERGTVVCNPLHIATDPSTTRINSFWVINDEIMTGLPSTIYTPMPLLKYKRPAIADQISDLAKKLAAIG